MSDQVHYERVDTTAVLTINRPHCRNAVDGNTASLLLEGFERFEADNEALVLILAGADSKDYETQAFCSGADLKAIESLDLTAPGGPLGFTRLTSSKPTIAAIAGWCLAGGLELACWCDLRIAGEDSAFGLAERRWGVPLIDGGTQRLARIIGQGRALDLVMTGRMIEAAEALQFGLVTEVVAKGQQLVRARTLAASLAQFPQETLRSDRRAVIEGAGLPLAEGLALEDKLGHTVLQIAQRGAAKFASGEGRHGKR